MPDKGNMMLMFETEGTSHTLPHSASGVVAWFHSEESCQQNKYIINAYFKLCLFKLCAFATSIYLLILTAFLAFLQ